MYGNEIGKNINGCCFFAKLWDSCQIDLFVYENLFLIFSRWKVEKKIIQEKKYICIYIYLL